MMRIHIDPIDDRPDFYLLTPRRQAGLAYRRMLALEILITVLVADFASGIFHWLEDAYGRESWPVTGRLITKPNILHHRDARHFTRHGWFHSSWLLILIAGLIVLVAWLSGTLTWHVWLFASLGANANQIHKWAHRSPAENGRIISFLQWLRVVQTQRHHAHHHMNPKNSRYCVLTNFLNPVLDSIRLWDRMELAVWTVFGVRRRVDESVTESNHIPGRSLPPAQFLGTMEVARATSRSGM
jgi:plasmanylethanolamine desaturase